MLEEVEFTTDMDRKPTGRQSSVPPKPNAGESRKEAGNNSTRYSKSNNNNGSKRREANGSRQMYDGPGRRPVPQKQRPQDRRPRPRNYPSDRQREEVAEGQHAERGSALMQGSKKANLNHLLNFSFAPRDGYGRGGGGGYGGWRGFNKWSGSGKRSIKYNKEQFLQANCQFVVRDTGDYSACGLDPDILVDWEMIEQVRIFSHEIPSCPICLFPPTAAKITRCGHIYCWACMLHYLSLGEKTWRKCPICYECVLQKDLKSVVAMEVHSYAVGEEITLKLMKRDRSSTFSLPIDQWAAREQPHNIQDTVDTHYSKLLVATADQVQDIITVERSALQVQQAELAADSLEESYVTAAFTLLKEREKSNRVTQAVLQDVQEAVQRAAAAAANTATSADDGSKSGIAAAAGPVTHKSPSKDIVHYASAFSDEEAEVEEAAEDKPHEPSVEESPSEPHTCSESSEASANQSPPGAITMATKEGDDTPPANQSPPASVAMTTEEGESVNVPVDVAAEELALPASEERSSPVGGARMPNAHYYFYQAADGQHIYLHSVNARCLVKQYGGLQNCPETITATIVEVEGISMTQELRRRLKYLGHLPLTCEFRVVELALQPPVVFKQTLDFFNEEISRRRRQRQRKSRDEQRTLSKSQRAADKKLGRYPQLGLSVSSDLHFPDYDSVIVPSEAPLLAAAATAAGSNSTSAESTPVGSPPDAADGADGQAGSFSFAQMLRKGKAKPADPWAQGPKVGDPATTPDGGKDDESDSEDRVPVPAFQESFGDAIQAALDSYKKTPEKGGMSAAPVEMPAASGSKKKKKQKKLLFTTSMARNW